MQSHKVVLCGDVFVGKSAIFMQAQHGEYREHELQSTISATFAQVRVTVPDSGDSAAAAAVGLSGSQAETQVKL